MVTPKDLVNRLKCQIHIYFKLLAPVVQAMDSTIHRINYSPVDKYQGNQLHYPLDKQCYPAFEKLKLSERVLFECSHHRIPSTGFLSPVYVKIYISTMFSPFWLNVILTPSFFALMQMKTFKHFFEYGTVTDTVIKSVLVTFVQESINASILIPDYSAIYSSCWVL